MEIVRDVFVLLHLVGFAALFGGAFAQIKAENKVINKAMLHGAWLQLATGVVLVGLAEARAAAADLQVNHVKIGFKLAILVVILVLVLGNRKKDAVTRAVYWSVLGLAFVDAAIAVFVPGMLAG